MATGSGKAGSLERHIEWLRGAHTPKQQEPTSKKSSLKTSAPGNKDAMEPKGGYKSKA